MTFDANATKNELIAAQAEEIRALRAELQRSLAAEPGLRWNVDPADAQRSVVKLVLTLVDLIRELLERQAIRRTEEGTLMPDETERIGLALMKLEETIVDLAMQFGIDRDDLTLELGPLGRLK